LYILVSDINYAASNEELLDEFVRTRQESVVPVLRKLYLYTSTTKKNLTKLPLSA
jgi:hypothetical protein